MSKGVGERWSAVWRRLLAAARGIPSRFREGDRLITDAVLRWRSNPALPFVWRGMFGGFGLGGVFLRAFILLLAAVAIEQLYYKVDQFFWWHRSLPRGSFARARAVEIVTAYESFFEVPILFSAAVALLLHHFLSNRRMMEDLRTLPLARSKIITAIVSLLIATAIMAQLSIFIIGPVYPLWRIDNMFASGAWPYFHWAESTFARLQIRRFITNSQNPLLPFWVPLIAEPVAQFSVHATMAAKLVIIVATLTVPRALWHKLLLLLFLSWLETMTIEKGFVGDFFRSCFQYRRVGWPGVMISYDLRSLLHAVIHLIGAAFAASALAGYLRRRLEEEPSG